MKQARIWMFAASSFWGALLLVGLVFRGGGAVPLPVEPRAEPPSLTLAAQAEARARGEDYEGAWRLYYRALQAAPEDVALWYGLGVVLSRLDRPREAERAFRYVVEHGRPDSEEARAARNWLVRAGALTELVTFTVSSPAVVGNGDRAAVTGMVTWGARAPRHRAIRVQLLLAGVSGDAEGKRFRARTSLGGAYAFRHLPAGSYRLIGAAAGQRLWDLRLDVADGRGISLDLGKDNSERPGVEL